MSNISNDELDGVSTSRLLDALSRRCRIVVLSIALKPAFSGPEAEVRERIECDHPGQALTALGMATLLAANVMEETKASVGY